MEYQDYAFYPALLLVFGLCVSYVFWWIRRCAIGYQLSKYDHRVSRCRRQLNQQNSNGEDNGNEGANGTSSVTNSVTPPEQSGLPESFPMPIDSSGPPMTTSTSSPSLESSLYLPLPPISGIFTITGNHDAFPATSCSSCHRHLPPAICNRHLPTATCNRQSTPTEATTTTSTATTTTATTTVNMSAILSEVTKENTCDRILRFILCIPTMAELARRRQSHLRRNPRTNAGRGYATAELGSIRGRLSAAVTEELQGERERRTRRSERDGRGGARETDEEERERRTRRIELSVMDDIRRDDILNERAISNHILNSPAFVPQSPPNYEDIVTNVDGEQSMDISSQSAHHSTSAATYPYPTLNLSSPIYLSPTYSSPNFSEPPPPYYPTESSELESLTQTSSPSPSSSPSSSSPSSSSPSSSSPSSSYLSAEDAHQSPQPETSSRTTSRPGIAVTVLQVLKDEN